ncbi:uncharacterized protein LAJ45_11352 [Morchella importuna]|uniref:uncharacterized protein n=1 Tax=Morchella importuna TaxID=1174673 RepID=UPI001E8CA9DD|nr:uncharacterized protein LAJ45_11352 [Morchella importuna]KAH8144643.1 hypothetical protein LAJ45_11352 [Morchella importuna]
MPFPDLFGGNPPPAEIFESTAAETIDLVRRIINQPGLVGLPAGPSYDLAKFFPTATEQLGVPTPADAVFLDPATEVLDAVDMEQKLIPVLLLYCQILKTLVEAAAGDMKLGMTAVIFRKQPYTYFVGATIPTLGIPDEEERLTAKNVIQAFRFGLLLRAYTEAGISLPPMPPILEVELVKYMIEIYPTKRFGIDPNALPAVPKDEKLLYLGWLYLQLLRLLVGECNGTRPIVLKKRANLDLGEFDEWRKRIVSVIISGPEPLSDPHTESVLNNTSPSQDLPPNLDLAIELEPVVAASMEELYGHCAETYPVLHILSEPYLTDSSNHEGLAIRGVGLTDIIKNIKNGGALNAKSKKAFAEPCVNCRSLIKRMGIDEVPYNRYIGIKKPKNPLVDYAVGVKTGWES